MASEPRQVSFTVPGRAQPAGSKRAFPRKGGGVVVTDDNPRAKPWQAAVAAEAAAAFPELAMAGPLKLAACFIVARPKSHYGAGRNSERVRPTAPSYPATRPDLTKLVRCAEDALTGVLWRDDAQVVTQHLEKRYGWPERTLITVLELEL